MVESFPLHLTDHFLFIGLGVVVPLLTALSHQPHDQRPTSPEQRRKLYANVMQGLWFLAAVVLVLWWWQDRPFSHLGLRWTPASLGPWSIGSAVVALLAYGLHLTFSMLSKSGRKSIEDQISSMEVSIVPRDLRTFLHFIPLALSAAICEEIIFRGYLIGYLLSLLGEQPAAEALAIMIPAICFTLGHIYQSRKAMIQILVLSIFYGVFYLLTGSIYLLILVHFLYNLMSGITGLCFPEAPAAEEEGPQDGDEGRSGGDESHEPTGPEDDHKP
ncbi:MAG: CPBP family intramembrane glutamic endopeptidase [Akkermansiaceae bacterium]|nr:CPBP family intramembrane glutamic endopeptidase [Akkermansiaceae bacterium]